MKSLHHYYLPLIITLCLSQWDFGVNKSIHIEDGRTVKNGISNVNGSIIIGAGCKIYGECTNVNGRIEIGSNSNVEDIQSVNGRIKIEKDVTVKGDIGSVNGPITCERGVKIEGDVSTVNGSIDLENTSVKKDVSTYNGDITLLDKSIIRGDIIVEESKGSSDRNRRLKIEITEKSVVEGDIIVKEEDIEVKVYISDGGKVKGKIRNAEVIEK